ncbi:MAG: PAS domain S-box protein [Nostoc sp.]|uniref:PAS domain S-box protein n=1 Tax=Nostoc sp. TaxID=1180 RepID=UPI002FF9C84C
MLKVPQKILIMRSWLLTYGVMVLAVIAALVLTGLLLPVFDPSVFTLFYAAVAISAWYGGMELGVLAIALSLTTALYFLIEPIYSFDFLRLNVLVQLTTFSLVSFLITALSSELRTARRKAETSLKLLQNSEMRFSRLAESNIIGVIVTDINNGSIMEANDAFLKMVGYTREDLSANQIKWREITPPEYLLLSERSVEELRTVGVCKPFEKEYICKDGTRVPVLLGSVFVEDSEETVIGFVVDLSQRKQAEQILREKEERLRLANERFELAASAVNCLIYDWNLEQDTVERTDGLTRILGYSLDIAEPTANWWRELVHPEDLQRVEEEAVVALANGDRYTAEYRIRNQDNQYIYILDQKIVVERDANGKPVRIVGSTTDISDLKQAKKALSQTQEQFQAFMDNIPAAAWITNGDGGVLYLSPTYRSIFDIATNKAINKNIFDLYPAEIAQPFLDNIRIVAQTNQVVETIESAPRTDGTLGEFLVYQFPIANASGQRLVGGVAVDITERERILRERQLAELALQERSERLKLLSETTSDLLSTERPLDLMNSLFSKLSAQMDLHFYFHYLIETHENQQKLRLVAWNGITDQVFQAIEYLEFNQGMCGLIAQERRQIVINDVLNSTHPNAQILHSLEITAYAGQPLIAQGKLLGVLSFASRTRTRFTSGEIALLQATSDQVAVALERAQLMDSLQKQKEQLVQANRIKDEFLAVLSHELRTPLNPILGWSKLLQTKKYDEATTTRALETIERNAKLQTQLIEDLLDVSRILQGKLSLNIAPINLETAIAAAIETVRLSAQAKSINLRFTILDLGLENSQRNLESIDLNNQAENLKSQIQFAPQAPQRCNSKLLVTGDSSRLQQVIWNLLSNAIKFTPEGGQVEISLKSVGYQAQLQVSDTGKGISPDFLPFVFDYFRQADGATTRKFGGLGLGLAIVHHIVELHGGTVKAESLGEEQGATFTIMLPMIKIHPNSQQIDRQPDNLPDLNGVKVLLVDDERDTRELIAFILEQSGAVVTQVASAMEALQALPQFQPNLLLTDIGMPEIDGYMLMRQIRAMSPEEGGKIPAIALTAYASEADYQQAIAAGFGQHITKPVEPAKLVRAIANLIF